MFHLILTACLAGPAPDCAPVLLPQGDAPDQARCEAGADAIARDWLAGHPDLVGDGVACRANTDLPAADLRELAPGVHVHFGQIAQMETSPDGRIANLGVVIGEQVAVIDAGVSRAEGQALYVALRRLTDRPVSHVILTHLHPDHILGASVMAEAGAEIVAHAALPAALEARGPVYLDNIRQLYPPTEWIGTQIVLPDQLVGNRAQIDLGGRELRLTAFGPAHTDSDLTVFDSVSQTLFTGDLIFRGLTPVVDGSLRGWLDWMDRKPDPMPRIIVPGHGPAADSWSEANNAQHQFLKALSTEVERAIAAGSPLSRAVEDVANALDSMKDSWQEFPQTVRRNATAAYKELEWE
ncbi:MAG: quinoprotein relay system zinc metallohydrolase 2 [Paracoccus sp. (in: a-proteobacteria)]|uniref:quinoprotein relay system zinc metallohydrolase 2 n=1 Tax=Paracoccus sp. TaxID=267 RepID=UPI00391B7F9F